MQTKGEEACRAMYVHGQGKHCSCSTSRFLYRREYSEKENYNETQ